MKKKKKKLLHVFGWMLTLCLLLTNTGTQTIFAANKAVTKAELIPASITVDSPRTLSKISLPGNSYGTLSWKDGTKEVTADGVSYEAVFRAAADAAADFSQVSGWNAASRTVTGKVTVYVKSLKKSEPSSKNDEKETAENETKPTDETADDAEKTPETSEEPKIPEDTDAGAAEAKPETSEDGAETENTETAEQPAEPEASEESGEEKVTEPIKESEAAEPEKTETTEPEVPAETPKEPAKDTAAEDISEGETTEELQQPESLPKDEVIEQLPEAETPENEKETETEETEQLPESPAELVEEEIRPTEVHEDMSLEEQAQAAAANHTSQGITVSADFLPWYVQFRVSDGSGFGFTNTADASTFQAYEFQLWDLLNDTEYTIPEGKTVQVTMPAAAGYDYSIQHILDDGSVEMITPNVYGSTLVFTTGSFSPFGIAGSKPLVGGDIAGGGYGVSSRPGTDTAPNTNTNTTAPGSTKPSAPTAAPQKPSASLGGSTAGSTGSSSYSGSQSGSSNSSSYTANSSQTKTNQKQTLVQAVRTGDETGILPYVMIALGALLVILVVVLVIRGKNNRKK